MVTDTPANASRQLSLGISPCPNDTFIFHALLKGLTPKDFQVARLVMADVEELNALACAGALDVVKMSLACVAGAARHYRLLSCGGALGRGCGPLLVAAPGTAGPALDPALGGNGATLEHLPIRTLALPGGRTTAALLAGLARTPGKRVMMRYDQIMPAVAAAEVDAGVLIHEGRFTYAAQRLTLLADFGQWWEERFGLPLPLGVIGVRRGLGAEVASGVARAIRLSLEHAWENPEDSKEFVAANAQELSGGVQAAHIRTFVTPFSLDVGQEGRRAIAVLAREAFQAASLACEPDLFWES